MKGILILISLIITLQSCQSQQCENVLEIGFIYNYESENDRQAICLAYENNRELFFKLKNDSTNYGHTQIEEILSKSNVSKKAIDQFIEHWHTMAKEHRLKTQQRDSIYLEGVHCLQNIINQEQIEFNSFIQNNVKSVKSSLTKKQIQKVQKGIIDYRKFNNAKKEQFRKEETLLFGQLGENIISYNQLSFEIIEKYMTSQYSFGLKNNYSNDMIELYKDNKILNDVFANYRQLEESIVEHITSDECFKRIGILRYYDGLNEERKEKAIRINMLMNMLK